MYPLGLLFGLGLRHRDRDRAARRPPAPPRRGGLPFYAILCLPILFAAGMSLLDTIDGAFMNFAYGWAFSKPVRKVYYNITITALSVAVALIIGTIELLVGLRRQAQPHRRHLGLRLRPRPQLRRLRHRRPVRRHLVLALAVWRFGRIEERWSARLDPGRERRRAAARAVMPVR